MEIHDSLPIHPVPARLAAGSSAAPELLITGLVERPGSYAAADLGEMRRDGEVGDFSCRAGWVVEGLEWEGVRLGDVLAAAGALPDGRYVRVISGDYAFPLAIDDVSSALLCDRLNGEPLALEHGAPWRLLMPGGACFTSVKWIERLDVVADAGANTAEQIALARLGQAPLMEGPADR